MDNQIDEFKTKSPVPFVSIIIPAKNEERLIEQCLNALNALEYPRNSYEIIVADGQSTDNTVKIAEKLGARVVANPSGTVSPGRNIAFKQARGDIIAFTDADCVADVNWLKNSIKYFDDETIAGVGGPNLTPENETLFGKAVGFVFGQAIFAAGSVHARNLKEIKKVRSIPGCNAIYKREALEKVMPVDEGLLTCDDTEMNQRIIDNGYSLLYTPDVFVWHYRRPTHVRLWKQMYRYAIGRLQVGKRDKRMINVFHILVGITPPMGIVVLFFSRPLFASLFLIYALFLFIYFLVSLFKTGSFKVSLRVPAVISIIFFAWSTGFMRELIYPIKNSEIK